MSVHYKFKSALDFSTVTFDGIHISVSDLKKEIIEQKHLKQNADLDLQIINAQTKEVYEDEKALIPKNTSVIVARIPVTEKRRTTGPGGGGGTYGGHHRSHYHHHPRNFPPTSVQPSALAKAIHPTMILITLQSGLIFQHTIFSKIFMSCTIYYLLYYSIRNIQSHSSANQIAIYDIYDDEET